MSIKLLYDLGSKLVKEYPKITNALRTGKDVVKKTADYSVVKPVKGVGTLVDKAEKAFPKTTAATMGLGEGYVAYEGAKTAYEGIRDEDYAKAALGIGTAVLPSLYLMPKTSSAISKAFYNKTPSGLMTSKGKPIPVSDNIFDKASKGLGSITKPGKYVPEKIATSVALAAPGATNIFEEAMNPPLDVGPIEEGKNAEAYKDYMQKVGMQKVRAGLVDNKGQPIYTMAEAEQLNQGYAQALQQDKNFKIMEFEKEGVKREDLQKLDTETQDIVKSVEKTEEQGGSVFGGEPETEAVKAETQAVQAELGGYKKIDDQKDTTETKIEKSTTNEKIHNNNLNKKIGPNSQDGSGEYNAPSDILSLRANRQKAFDEYSKSIEEIKDRMANKDKQTFEQFYQEFRQRAGMDVPQNDINYIIMKMGLAMMSAKTYDSGASGFLEILGQAGGQAVEEAYKIYQQERELQQNLVGNFMKYERELDMYYDQAERDLTLKKAELGVTLAEGDLANAIELYKIDAAHLAKLSQNAGAGQEKVGDNLVFQFDGLIKGRDASGTDVSYADTHYARGYRGKNGNFYVYYDIAVPDANNPNGTRLQSGIVTIDQYRKMMNIENYTRTDERTMENPESRAKRDLKLKYNRKTLDSLQLAFEKQPYFGGQALVDRAGFELIGLNFYEDAKGILDGIRNLTKSSDARYYGHSQFKNAQTPSQVFSEVAGTSFINEQFTDRDGNLVIDADGANPTGAMDGVVSKAEQNKYNRFKANEINNINKKLKDAEKKYNSYIKKNNITDENERLQLAKALGSVVFIENQLMYAYANMNKTEDRITVKDIENAQGVTGLKAYRSGKTIRATYELMRKQVLTETINNIRAYQQVTGLSYDQIIINQGLGQFKADLIPLLKGNRGLVTTPFTETTDEDLAAGVKKKPIKDE